MTHSDIDPLREILHRALVRYLTVKPGGFEYDRGERLRPVINARILSFGGARTFYQQHRPHCRSLDGVTPIKDSERTCAECKLRSKCTPQVRLDLMADCRAFRLLLAHTSAKGFLVYEAELRQRNLVLASVLHRIEVINRGSWGELRFSTQADERIK